MGVYIKDMEMPTGGDSILFRIDEKGEVVAYKVRGCKADFLNRYKAMLIPPHGNLIDRDALRAYVDDYYKTHISLEASALMVALDRTAPTVIEAEDMKKREVDVVDVQKHTLCNVPWSAVELYELSDGFGETVHVKPCRRCYERRGEITKPEFVWFSDDINFINYYRIECPKCFDEYCSSGMSGTDLQLSEIESRWNDWDKTLEKWEEDLDW